ncbi:MAG: hypothetical protein WC400_03175 [Patescibacteria group bacterium]|jgi:hypothetical protein
MDRSTEDVTVNNIATPNTAIGASNMSEAQTLTANYVGAALTGTTDSVTVNLSNVATAATVAIVSTTTSGVEEIVVSSTGNTNKLTALTSVDSGAATEITKVTVTGDKALTITTALDYAGTTTGTFDASAATGAVTMGMDVNLTQATVKGGSGNDVIDMSTGLNATDVIDGGAGTDKLKVVGADSAATTLDTTLMTNITNIEELQVQSDAGDALVLKTNATMSKVILVENATNGTAMTTSDLAANAVVELVNNVDTAHAIGAVVLGLKDASGTTDTLNVTVKGTTAHDAADNTIASLTVSNIETLALTSSFDGTVALLAADTNTITSLVADTTLTKITAAGSDALSFTMSGAETNLATIDASAMTDVITVNMTNLTSNVAITTGSEDDLITMGATLTNADTINGGSNSTDTTNVDVLTATVTGLTATTGALHISNVERVNLTNAGTAVINAAGITGTTEVAIAEDAAAVSTTVTGLSTTAALGLGFNGTANAATVLGTVIVSLADETGTTDALTINMNDTTDGDTNTVTLKTTAIETVTFAHSTTAAALASTTVTSTDFKATTINVTGSDTDVDNTFTLGTLNAATTTVNASTFTGILSATTAAGVATTMSAKGGYASVLTGSTGSDTFSVVGDAGTAIYDISGLTGTLDTLNATLSSTASDFTSVDGIETMNLSVKASTSAGFDNATKDNGLNAATTVNILGGNALSSFVMTTATIDAASAMTVNASTFAGHVELNLASDAFDADLTIIGSALTTDKVTTIIAANAGSGTNKIKSMSGVETLIVTSTNSDVDSEIDLTNVTGLTTIDAQFTNGANADKMQVLNIADGVNVKVTSSETADQLVLDLTNKTATNNTLNVEVTAMGAGSDILNLDIAQVETLNFNLKNTNAVSLNLDGVTVTGTGTETALTFTGAKDATISGAASTIGDIDASTLTGALTITARTNTAANDVKTGSGNDTIIMANTGDTLNASTGTDTLVVAYTSVIGGMAIDLSNATDQITTFNGSSNAAVQVGFENVNLTGYTGNGAEITAATTGSTIVGTTKVDSITLGAGTDTVDFNAVGSIAGTAKDVINNYGSGVDVLTFDGSEALVVAEADGVTATSDVDTSATGLITFHANDDTYAEKVTAIQADGELDAANSVAIFTDGTSSYLYYAGTATGNTDDQIIELVGGVAAGLDAITITGTGLTIA